MPNNPNKGTSSQKMNPTTNMGEARGNSPAPKEDEDGDEFKEGDDKNDSNKIYDYNNLNQIPDTHLDQILNRDSFEEGNEETTNISATSGNSPNESTKLNIADFVKSDTADNLKTSPHNTFSYSSLFFSKHNDDKINGNYSEKSDQNKTKKP